MLWCQGAENIELSNHKLKWIMDTLLWYISQISNSSCWSIIPLVLSEFRLVYNQYQLLSHSSIQGVLSQLYHKYICFHTILVCSSTLAGSLLFTIDLSYRSSMYSFHLLCICLLPVSLFPSLSFMAAAKSIGKNIADIFCHIFAKVSVSVIIFVSIVNN